MIRVVFIRFVKWCVCCLLLAEKSDWCSLGFMLPQRTYDHHALHHIGPRLDSLCLAMTAHDPLGLLTICYDCL